MRLLKPRSEPTKAQLQQQIDVLRQTVAEQGQILASLCAEGRLLASRELQREAFQVSSKTKEIF